MRYNPRRIVVVKDKCDMFDSKCGPEGITRCEHVGALVPMPKILPRDHAGLFGEHGNIDDSYKNGTHDISVPQTEFGDMFEGRWTRS